ncbi:hypothetical protein E4U41_005751, partial [Claviceps citrina]
MATTGPSSPSSSSSSSSASTTALPMLVSLDSHSHTHLIIGLNALTPSRCAQSLSSGARPILIAPAPASPASPAANTDPPPALPRALEDKITAGLLTWHQTGFQDAHLRTLGRPQVDHVVDAVFVTLPAREAPLAERISSLCRRLRIPVNVVDAPHLCSFSLLSVHVDGPLQ